MWTAILKKWTGALKRDRMVASNADLRDIGFNALFSVSLNLILGPMPASPTLFQCKTLAFLTAPAA